MALACDHGISLLSLKDSLKILFEKSFSTPIMDIYF